MNEAVIILTAAFVIPACGGRVVDAPVEAGTTLDGSDASALDGDEVFDAVPSPCPQGGGLQPGSPWPAANRCPTRESRTNLTVTLQPTVKWTVQTSGGHGGAEACPLVIAADGTVYVGGRQLQAVTQGAIKWSFADSTSNQLFVAAMVARDGSIYSSSWDGTVYALDVNGHQKWAFAPPCTPDPMCALGCIGAPPEVADDGTIYTGVSNGVVSVIYALDAAGNFRWSYALPSSAYPAYIGPITISYDGTILFGRGSSLIALDSTGRPKWTWSSGLDSSVGTASVESDGTIYVLTDGQSALHAIGSDGIERWQFTLGNSGDQLMAPAIGPDGTAYIGGYEGLGAIRHGITGTSQWVFGAYGEVLSSPTVGGNGVVYFGNTVGAFAIASTGVELWKLSVPNEGIPWSGLAVGTGGYFYGVDEFGLLYAMGP